MAIGTILSASASQQEGYVAMNLAKRQQAVNEVAAGQAIAVGQHRAFEEKRQADLMASRAVAVASAGGHAQDIDNLIADIHGEGLYRANLAMYEAETESERIRYEGELGVEVGEAKQRAAEKRTTATVISGLGQGLSYSTRT